MKDFVFITQATIEVQEHNTHDFFISIVEHNFQFALFKEFVRCENRSAEAIKGNF